MWGMIILALLAGCSAAASQRKMEEIVMRTMIASALLIVAFAFSGGIASAAISEKFPQSKIERPVHQVQKCTTYRCCMTVCGERGGSNCAKYCGSRG